MDGWSILFTSWFKRLCVTMLVVTAPSVSLLSEELKPVAETIEKTPAKKHPHGRLITIRYQETDFSGNEHVSHEKPVETLADELRQTGADRVILPDPFASKATESQIKTAEVLADAGYGVLIELSPLQEAIKESSARFFQARTAAESAAGYLKRVEKLTALKTPTGKKVVTGFFLPMAPLKTLPGAWDAGFDAVVFEEFLEETGLKREWASKLLTDEQRRGFIRSVGLMPWMTWRTRKIADFYARLSDEIEEKTGLKVAFAAPTSSRESASTIYEEAERAGFSPLIAWRWMGFEPSAWKSDRGLEFVSSESIPPGAGQRDATIHPDLENAFGDWPVRGHWLASNSPALAQGTRYFERYTELVPDAESAIVAGLARRDIQHLILDHSIIAGQEIRFAALAQRFQNLPVRDSETVTETQLQGLAIRSYPRENSTVIAFFNPLPCRMEVELSLKDQNTKELVIRHDSLDLIARKTDAEPKPNIHIALEPKSWGTIELKQVATESVSFLVELPDESRDVVQTRYEALLDHRPATTGAGRVLPGSVAETTRGRRLMAALQAYRESRFADFFRLSDGILSERRAARQVESTARGFQDDLSDRPKIR